MTTGFFLGSIKDLTIADAVATQTPGSVPATTTNCLAVTDNLLDSCVDTANSVFKVQTNNQPTITQIVSGATVIGQDYTIDNSIGTKTVSLFGSVSGACNITIYYSPDNFVTTFQTSLGAIALAGAGDFSRDFTTSAPYISIRFDAVVTANVWVSLLP